MDSSPTWHVVALACLGGVAQALDRASTRNAGDEFGLGTIVGAAIVLGPLLGIGALWIFGALLALIGRWHGRWHGRGGSAPSKQLRLVLAWANVPPIFGLVLWIPMFALVGQEIFSEFMPTVRASPGAANALTAIGVVQATLGVWGTYILCHGIAEVQGLRSAWMGLVHALAVVALILVPFLLIAVTMRLVT